MCIRDRISLSFFHVLFIQVVDIDVEKKRFVVTAKPSELVPSTEDHDFFSKFNHVNLLEHYFGCRNNIFKAIEQNKGKFSQYFYQNDFITLLNLQGL